MTSQRDFFQHSVARQDSTSSPGPSTAGTSPSMLPPNALQSSARFPSPPSLAPPRFIVNLSDPPETRYAHIASAFEDQVDTLPALYQEVLETLFSASVAKVINPLSRLLLRNVFDKEETSELRGISKATGIRMHLLVAFNVLLDLFMGCTSGGVRVRDPNSKDGSKMLHFRGLDWGMDQLRKLVVELEYVRTADGPVLGRSVTYFGYVGVLTGVRHGLSMSINFRACHDRSNIRKRVSYGMHLLMVLFGYRRSISSVLRGYLLPDSGKELTLDELVEDLTHQKSTSAFLIFCDKHRVLNMEKDNGSARVQQSTDFLVTLNHDLADEGISDLTDPETDTMAATGMEELVAGSVGRKGCVVRLYERAREWRRKQGFPEMPLEEDEVVAWMEGAEVVHGETHLAVIMDPAPAEITWIQRFEEPVNNEDKRKERRGAEFLRRRNAWSGVRERARQDLKEVLADRGSPQPLARRHTVSGMHAREN